MKKKKNIRLFGVNKKGVIIFFLGKQKYRYYYRSILLELSKNGYLIIAVPYGIKKPFENIYSTLDKYNLNDTHLILMSHSQGDNLIYWFSRTTTCVVDKIIVCSPNRGVIHYKDIPTLVLWSNKYNSNVALDIFGFAKKRSNYHFIGYPNCSRYLFAGVGYSQYHDRYEKKPKKTFYEVDKYNHIEKDVIEDITLYLQENKIREKVAIFSENYLPFYSGVNILTKVLKTELEKKDIKVYPVTLKLKGVNYLDYNQDKNVVIFPSVAIPGKKARAEALQLSTFYSYMMRHLRAYQFDYIQLQTEFTIGKAAMLLRKKDNVPMVYTAHTMWNDMMDKRLSKPIAKIVNYVINKFLIPPLKYADLMTVPTEKVKKYYMETWNKKEPIIVIPGCVDGDNFAMSKEDYELLNKIQDDYQLKDKIVLGYIGRVSKEKSINVVFDYFEKAAPEIPNLSLMIVGDGPYLNELTKRVKNSQFFERIIIVGQVSNNKLKYYYRLFTAFCTASTFETQGLTYIESMWCQTPVLAKYDHCLDHFLSNNVNGVTFIDYDSWREGLNKIIADKEFVKKINEEAYKTALSYAKEVWAKKMYYLYVQAKLFNEGKIHELNYNEFNKIK